MAKHAAEVAGIVFVDVAHPDQWNRFPPELQPGLPPSWIIQPACDVGAVRLLWPSGYPGIPERDSLNLIVSAFLPNSLPAMIEELTNVRSLADEAAAIRSFGDLPLIVITGTGESRKDEYPTEQLASTFTSLWGEMQEDLLKMSSRSKRVLAAYSGHFIMLDQPMVTVDAIRELVVQTRNRQGSGTTR